MSNLYDNEMKLEFLSKSNNEAFARITVAAFAAQLDPTIEELADIKTAVSEAVTNAIIHGYEDMEGIITVSCKIFANTIVIEVSDNGKGIENVRSGVKGNMYVILRIVIPKKLSRDQKKLFEKLEDTNLESGVEFKKLRDYVKKNA